MFRDLLAHMRTNPSGRGARFLRLLPYFATFALVIGTFLPFMSKLAYSEGTLSYEIRATFITSAPSADNLKIKIKEDPQATITRVTPAENASDEDEGDGGDVQELNSGYSKCRVVFTVTSSNSSLYTAGKKITCVWTSSGSAPDDPQNCGQEVEIRKDQKTGNLYSDVTFYETYQQIYDVTVIDSATNDKLKPQGNAIKDNVFIKDVPFLVDTEEQKCNVEVTDENETGLRLAYYVPVDNNGHAPGLLLSQSTEGSTVNINKIDYQIEKVKIGSPTDDHALTITVKKLTDKKGAYKPESHATEPSSSESGVQRTGSTQPVIDTQTNPLIHKSNQGETIIPTLDPAKTGPTEEKNNTR